MEDGMGDDTGESRPLHPATLAAQAMGTIDPATGALVPPIHTASTFERDPDNAYPRGLIYGRDDNPGVRQAEAVLTALEDGHDSRLFASGMAAASAVFMALAPGDHVLAPRVMYWALRNWLDGPARAWGLEPEFIDMTDLAAVQAAVRPGQTKLIWIETPGNPTWVVTDIAAAGEIATDAGALLAVDSTVATPMLTRPLAHGADIVMHSATKYLNGHSDVIAGALTAGGDSDLWQRICHHRAEAGAILGPMEAAMLLRGMRTLPLRVERACRSAILIASRMAAHRGIRQVLYPGLASHPGHAIAARQMTGGFGGMLSIRVAGGEAGAIGTAARVKVWKRATSLGGVESLIEHRASVEGAGSPAPPDMLRLSVGIEDPEDLIADLDQALGPVVDA